MKKAQRIPWIERSMRASQPICEWCRTCNPSVWEEDCAEWGCTHPLRDKLDSMMEPGDDCWGFRPRKEGTDE